MKINNRKQVKHPATGVMWRLLLAILVSIVCCEYSFSAHCAEAGLKTVQAKGSGKNRQEAIQAALIEAVSKVNGVILDASIATELASIERSNGKSTSYKSAESYSAKINKLTKGVISGWDVLNENRIGGQYEVEIIVSIAKIIGSGEHDTRKSIAVMLFQVNNDGNVNGQSIPAASLGKSYRESLLSYLTSSRKFAIVDDTFKDEVETLNAKRSLNQDVVQKALAKANRLGADYLAIGIGEILNVGDEVVAVGNSTATLRKCNGMVRLRVIKVESSQTVLAVDYRMDRLLGLDLSGAHPEISVFDALGRAMSDRLLDTIYPIRISSVTGQNEVILDRGGESIKTGDQYGVYRVGNKLTDAVTGESLGYEETLASTIEITRVLPKVSYAKVVGVKTAIEPEYICRHLDFQSTKKTKLEKMSSPVDDLFK